MIIERKEYFSFGSILTDRPEDYLASLDDIQGVISSLYMKSMIRTNTKLDKNVLNRLTNYLVSTPFIDVYGQGISFSNAQQFVYKLQSLGLPCFIQNQMNLKYIENIKNPKDHMAVIFCIEKSNEAIQNYVTLMKSKGIYTIVITCFEDDELIKQASDYLLFDVSSFNDLEQLTSAFSADYVTNIIYANLYYRLILSKSYRS